MTIKRYLLIGYLGANNLGDECMLRQFLSLFDEFPNVSFIIDSHGIDYTSDRIITHFIPSDTNTRRLEYGKIIGEVDGIIWVGGNCFTDYDGAGAVRLAMKAKTMGKRFYYVSVGTDRLTLFKRKWRAFLSLHLADSIIFRDKFSLNHAKSCFVNSKKLALAPDLGELYLRHNAGNYSVETYEIVVSWRELKKNISNQDELLENLSMFLVNLSALYNRRLIIFNTDEYSDKQVHASLIDLLIKHGFSNFTYVEDTTLEEKLTIISRACCVITARLHTAVAADVFDKPIVVYNYSQKISEFAFGKENVKVISGNLAELTADDIDLKEKTSKEAIAIDEKVYKNFAVQCKE